MLQAACLAICLGVIRSVCCPASTATVVLPAALGSRQPLREQNGQEQEKHGDAEHGRAAAGGIKHASVSQDSNGKTHSSPWNRMKSRSAVCTVALCAIAMAATCASVTRFGLAA